MHENEKRMAGDYEIVHALQVGDREIVLGENLMDANGQKYICAFRTANELCQYKVERYVTLFSAAYCSFDTRFFRNYSDTLRGA